MTHRAFLRLVRAFVVVQDAALIVISLAVAYRLRSRLTFLPDSVSELDPVLRAVIAAAVLLWVGTIAMFRGYATREFGSGTEVYKQVFYASLMVLAVAASTLFLTQIPLSRGFFLLSFAIGIPLLLLGRIAFRRFLHWFYREEHGGQRVMLVGSNRQVEELAHLLRGASWLGLRPVAAVVPTSSSRDGEQTVPRLIAEEGLFELAKTNDIDLILFTSGSVPSSTDFRRYVWQFEGHRTQLAVVPSLVDIAADRIRTRPVAGLPIVYVEGPHSDRALSPAKRFFDVLAAGLALIVLSPLLAVTALLVHRDGGPVLFTQERVGLEGKPFTMLKFRSMVVDAEKRLAELQGGNATNAVMFKLERDPRVTRVGSFIRRFSIDELPQLINVLRGDMSLIGPRPPLPREVRGYTDDEFRRLRVRPGLTGLWQVSGRSDLSWEETIRLDLYYIDNWSVVQDVAILLRTVRAVLSSRGAY